MPWALFDTSIGTCGLAWNDVGITHVQLPEATRTDTEARLRARAGQTSPRATERSAPVWVRDTIERARAHLGGQPQDFRAVPIDLTSVAPFTAEIYRALREVPAGTTVSYGELARAVGSPGGARAVGRAMATNPVPLLVPCQRVVGQAGKMVGFSAYGGVLTKERLLALESATARPKQAPLFAPAARRTLPYDARAATAHLASADRVLGAHVTRIGELGLVLEETESTFDALAKAIVYQQLHAKAAATIFGRVRALFPKGRLDPRAVLTTTDEDLRGAGLSKNKLLALRDLAQRAAAGRVPTLSTLEGMADDAIVDVLTEVRGVGRWTVEMLLIFRLGRPDVLPVTDYGIRKGFGRLFHRGDKRGEPPSEADVLRRGERWRPFRSVASWYLWRAAEL